MGKIAKRWVPLVLLVIAMALPGFVSAAPVYNVNLTPQPTIDSSITIGALDITGAFYGWDATNQYFKFDLRTAPNVNPQASSTVSWNIYIDSKTGGGQPNTSLTGIDYIISNTYTTNGGGKWQSPKLFTWSGSTWVSSTPSWLTFTPGTGGGSGSSPLEWVLLRNGPGNADATLGVNYDFWFGTADSTTPGATVTTKDLSAKFHTPIPAGAWLLGTGLIGLAVIRRRKS